MRKVGDKNIDRNIISIYVPFQKSDDETRMVYGYCTTETTDSQGEVVMREAIVKAWSDYMKYANVREMHQASAVGVTKEYTHDEQGTWIGVKVVDDRAWKFVQEGVYKAFSIGGRVTKRNKNIIQGIILSEISLVDRPANPDAQFSVTKVDDGLLDQLQLEANFFNKMKHKYVEIDGKKFKEDPANPGEPLKDEVGGFVELTAEEVAENDESTTETAEEITAREEKEKGDANEAAGLNRDGSAKEVKADEGAGGGADEGADEGADKGAKSEWTKKAESAGMLSKDSDGVLLLSDLLAHLEFVMSCFSSDTKDISALVPIKASLMEAIAGETEESGTAEMGAKTKDLAKMFGTQLTKALEPLADKIGSFEKGLQDVKDQLDVIKGQRISPRPVGGAVPVDKVIQMKDGDVTKSRTEALKSLGAVEAEIDTFSKEWDGKLKQDPSLGQVFMSKSSELQAKLRVAKQAVADAELA